MRCLVAFVLCLALAPAAAAEPVALMDAPRAEDIAVAGGARVVLAELRSPRFQSRVRVLDPGAEPVRLPWSGPPVFPPLALAGDHIALTGLDRVFVADRRSGKREASIALGRDNYVEELDLAPGGRVVAEIEGRLLTVAPGTPQAAVPGTGGLELSTPRFAGNHVGALELTPVDAQRPVVFPPGAGAPIALGVPSVDFEELAGNEGGFAWIANGCVLYAPVDGAPATEPPEGPCPRSEVVFENHEQKLHGRRIPIEVTCVAAPAAGCRGSVILREGRIVGRGRFSVPAGAVRMADVVLTRRGLRRVRRVLKREGDAFLELDAQVEDGRAPGVETQGIAIDRVARR